MSKRKEESDENQIGVDDDDQNDDSKDEIHVSIINDSRNVFNCFIKVLILILILISAIPHT